MSDSITITLPDGSQQPVPPGTKPIEVAQSIGSRLAAAVLELFPETKLGIGPPTENGFYYDFQREIPFTPEDLEKIEARMWELQAKDLPFDRKLTAKTEGLEKYADDWRKR